MITVPRMSDPTVIPTMATVDNLDPSAIGIIMSIIAIVMMSYCVITHNSRDQCEKMRYKINACPKPTLQYSRLFT